MKDKRQSIRFLVMWAALLAYPLVTLIVSAFADYEFDPAPNLNVKFTVGYAYTRSEREGCSEFLNGIAAMNIVCGTSLSNYTGLLAECEEHFPSQ